MIKTIYLIVFVIIGLDYYIGHSGSKVSAERISSQSGVTRFEFALTFNTTPINNVNHGIAFTQSLITYINAEAMQFEDAVSTDGDAVLWTSELTSTGPNNTWTEKGNLTFAFNSVLFFSSVGKGHAFDGPSTGDSYGGITYQIYDGLGVFQGASGVMVDTFVSTANVASFDINAWAIFWVPSR